MNTNNNKSTIISKFLSIKQLGEAIKWAPNPEQMAEQQIDDHFKVFFYKDIIYFYNI